MEKELEITKYNYKGYIKLYNAYESIPKKIKIRLKRAKNIKDTSESIGMIMLIAGAFLGCFEVASFIVIPTLCVFPIATIGGAKYYNKSKSCYNQMINEKTRRIKEKYPYVDLEVNQRDLEKGLRNVGIIKKIMDGKITLDVSSYENYIKCEEEKEKYLEEQKHNYPNVTFTPDIGHVKVLIKKINGPGIPYR